MHHAACLVLLCGRLRHIDTLFSENVWVSQKQGLAILSKSCVDVQKVKGKCSISELHTNQHLEGDVSRGVSRTQES